MSPELFVGDRREGQLGHVVDVLEQVQLLRSVRRLGAPGEEDLEDRLLDAARVVDHEASIVARRSPGVTRPRAPHRRSDGRDGGGAAVRPFDDAWQRPRVGSQPQELPPESVRITGFVKRLPNSSVP